MRKAVAIALVNGEKVLMQQRDNKPDIVMPGRWSLPGGEVEKNESLVQAIKREFKEETGYKLKNPKHLVEDSYIADGNKTEAYIFFETYDGKQEIKCREGRAMEFKSAKEIKKLNTVPRHDKFVLKAINKANRLS